MTTRRAFLSGLGAGIICAPAIVRASSLMKVKAYKPVISDLTEQSLEDMMAQMPAWGLQPTKYIVPPDIVRSIGEGDPILGIERLEHFVRTGVVPGRQPPVLVDDRLAPNDWYFTMESNHA